MILSFNIIAQRLIEFTTGMYIEKMKITLTTDVKKAKK